MLRSNIFYNRHHEEYNLIKTKKELGIRIKKAKTAVLIVNTYSRRGEKLFFRALDELQMQGVTITASYPVRHPDRLPEIVKEAIRRKGDLVIIGGGDGTISSVVDYFANRDIVFGLLPLGTGNSFARTLGIPVSLKEAVGVIVNGKVIEADLGKVNEDFFANVVSIGFPAEVARNTPNWLKKILGPLAYGVIGIKYLFSSKKFRCEMISNGKKYIVQTHHIIIANGSIYGISPIGLKTDIDNKQLLVLTMDMTNRWKLILFWIRFFTGTHHTLPDLKYFLTKEVKIITDPVRYIDIDGDSITQTPAKITLAPSALKIMVPESFHEHLKKEIA